MSHNLLAVELSLALSKMCEPQKIFKTLFNKLNYTSGKNKENNTQNDLKNQ